MFDLNSILSVTGATEQQYRSSRRGQKPVLVSHLEGAQIFPIGKTMPLFIKGRCEGLAKILSITIDAYGTTVTFNKIPLSDQIARSLERVYAMMGMHYGDANASRVDSDTERTGMSAAARMMMGDDRSPRQIARDAVADDDDDEDDGRTPGIWDMMKAANPDDPFFDD